MSALPSQPSRPARPSMLAVERSIVPQLLRDRHQWVVWELVWKDGDWTKVPLNARTGKRASVSDPNSWSSFEEAFTAYQSNLQRYAGVGFVITMADGLVGIDLDDCVDNGVITESAKRLIANLNSYSEFSPSGSGIKIWIQGSKPEFAQCKSSAIEGMSHVEVYSAGRYFTLTGYPVVGTPTAIESRQSELEALCRELWPPERETPKLRLVPHAVALDDDDELLKRAREAKNGDKFQRLFDQGDTSEYDGDESDADLALCSLLAFWTQGDAVAIDRLFRQSRLMRDKWDKRRGSTTYGQRTIARALKCKTEFYKPPRGGKNTKTSKNEKRALLMSDIGNAARLVVRCGDRIRHCHSTGRWFVWNGKRWRHDDRGQVVEHCKATALSIYSEAMKEQEDGRRIALGKWAATSQKRERLNAMADLARSDVAVIPDELDADRFLFNCLNGTIDLRTGELRPHNQNDLLTKLAPVEYDPNAKCPMFERFLGEIFCGDEELIDYIVRWHGYCLSGDIREQLLHIYIGDGENGKNVLLDTISGVMGPYAAEAPPDLLTVRKHPEHPTEIADLMGCRLSIVSETERDAQLRVQLIKRLTGNARLKGRFMRQNYVEFDRTHKLVLVTNNRPRINEDTHAIWRRLRIVPFEFTVQPSRRDLNLVAKLATERPGILALLVRGFQRWQESGLPHVAAITIANEEFRADANSFDAFVRSECILNPRAKCRTSDLRAAYETWCVDHNRVPEAPQCTSATLEGKGCHSRKFNSAYHWFGIDLKRSSTGHTGHTGHGCPLSAGNHSHGD